MRILIEYKLEVFDWIELATCDHLPHLSPNHNFIELWFKFVQVSYDKVKSFAIILLKDESMIIPVWQDGFNWTYKINIYCIEFIFIAENNISNHMYFIVVTMNKSNIQLL